MGTPFDATFEVKFTKQYLTLKCMELDKVVTVGSIKTKGEVTPLILGKMVFRLMQEKADKNPTQKIVPIKELRYLKITQAAKILGMSQQAVRNLVIKKKMKLDYSAGGHRLFKRSDLEELRLRPKAI